MTKARQLIERSLTPPTDAQVVAMLVKLSTLVAPNKDDETTADIRLAALGERLIEYPADVVADVLHEWPDRSVFWPRWKELKDLLDPKRAAREALLRAIDLKALAAPDHRATWLAEMEAKDPARAAMIRRSAH